MPTKAKVKGLEYDHASIYPNKKCLSSSQVLTYKENPSKFYTEYELGIRRKSSQAMYIGSVFSAAYADRKINWKKLLQEWNGGKGVRPYRVYDAIDEALRIMPDIGKRNAEYPLKCKYRGWVFRATLDGYWGNKVDIENKTGAIQWFQNPEQQAAVGDTTSPKFVNYADESEQITFQYWVKWIKDGELFDHCQLNWVDLRANATQRVHTFKTHRTIEQVEEFQYVIDHVLNGIEAQCWQ